MSTITNLNLKQLCEVLKDLKGGSIGFDVYRNPETNTKGKLLAYILANYGNPEIIAAIQRVTSKGSDTDTAKESTQGFSQKEYNEPYGKIDHPNADACPVIVTFNDVNRQKHIVGFANHAPALHFMAQNPTHHYTGRYERENYLTHKAAQTAYSETKFREDAFKAQTAQQAQEMSSAFTNAFETDAIFETKTVQQTNTVSAPEALQIAALIASMASKGAVDESKVIEICDKRAQDYVDNILSATNSRLSEYDAKINALQMPVTVNVLKYEEKTPVNLGFQHKNFANLLKTAQARTLDGNRLNIWLKGPAGSGKTTAAKKVSEALGMQFQFNGAISTEYELMGFKDATGTYHRTAFREVFENGGVYLFDEVDSSLPKAVLAFNAALANGECRFPDAMVNRHKDCVIIAGANTAGNGATSDYVGRMKQDLAFLNRFVILDWPLDEALEKALASNKDWVRKVQRYRANTEKRGIKGHIISPRATFYGEAMLAAGLDEEFVEQATLRGALTSEQWESLCQ